MDAVIVTALALAYAGALFGVAAWGERWAATSEGARRWRPVYALSLAVYCTSWTYYGAVGTAATAGWDYLPITLGPVLVFVLAMPLLERLARAVRDANAASIAEMISRLHGRSRSIAAMVAGIALLGAVPYLALQLKSMAMSYAAVTGDAGMGAGAATMLPLAVALAAFTIIFGARRYDATAHNRGLVVALAFDSAVKLAGLVAAGAFAAWLLLGLPDGRVAAALETAPLATAAVGERFVAVLGLAMLAIICLPRQFYIGFVEARDPADVRAARWPFSLYLLATALVALPVAVAGPLLTPGASPDLYGLSLPLAAGEGALAALVFVGGLAAAMGMLVTTSLALSIMLTHDLIVPLLLRSRLVTQGTDMGALLLQVRRFSIAGVIALAAVYAANLSQERLLASIGLVAFAAMAQFAPGLIGGLLWKGSRAEGVRAGLLTGGLLWFWTLFLPSYASDGGWLALPAGGWLDPHALFGLGGLDPLTHGVLWSLGVNLLCYVAVSRLAAGRLRMPALPRFAFRPLAAVRSRGELMRLAMRFAGEEATEAAFAALTPSLPDAPVRPEEAQAAERLIAAVVGASSARLIVTSAMSGDTLSVRDVAAMLDTTRAELRFSRELLATALDTISQGVSVVDDKLRLVAWNRRYLELFGFPPGFITVGRPIADVIRFNADRGECGPGEVDAHVERRLAHMRRGQPHVYERVRPNGTVLKTIGNPMPGGGYVSSFTDITAEKRAQEALEVRVAERTAELAEANAKLAEASRSKTRFLAAASHDLLQPLHAARLFTGALAAQPGQADMLAPRIDRSIQSAEQLLRTLLDISRLDAGGIEPKPEAVDVGALLEAVAAEVAPLAAERGLGLKVRARAGLTVATDPTLLKTIVMNFVSNALRYTAKGGVLLTARRRGGQALLQVWDTGIGIPEASVTAIFAEFHRLPASYAADKGAGLGLAIVERTAALLGAAVSVRSRVGHGSMFGVALPLAPEAAGVRPAAPAAAVPPAGLHLLLVDDSPAILEAMAAMLEGWGCTATRVETPSAARAALMREAFDAALVDYALGPGETGLDVLRFIAREAPAVPRALVTADASADVAAKAAGFAAEVLLKPLEPARLSSWLAGQAPKGLEGARRAAAAE